MVDQDHYEGFEKENGNCTYNNDVGSQNKEEQQWHFYSSNERLLTVGQ